MGIAAGTISGIISGVASNLLTDYIREQQLKKIFLVHNYELLLRRLTAIKQSCQGLIFLLIRQFDPSVF